MPIRIIRAGSKKKNSDENKFFFYVTLQKFYIQLRYKKKKIRKKQIFVINIGHFSESFRFF